MNPIEFLTLALVVITGYYAWQTRRTVKVMEAANEMNSRPVVSVALANDKPQGVSFVDFVVNNSGNGIAKDIKFSVCGDDFEVENIGSRSHPISEVSMIANGIGTLAPDETRRTWLLSTIGRVDELLSKKTTIKISYKNGDLSKSYEDSFVLDFASLAHIQLGHDPLDNIDKEIERIRRVLEKMK